MIKGSIVALITPMTLAGEVDWGALDRLIDWHIEQGTHAIVSVGTTGESPTLTVNEHLAVVKRTIDAANGRIPIIAGTGANSTAEAIELTRVAKDSGADASLQVVPYYNKPSQEGLYQHFSAIANAVDIPIILYNVPGRTVTDMSNDTTLRLAENSQFIGIKDATGDIDRGKDLIERAPEGFAVYSGDDPTALALMVEGGVGDISVTANVAPAMMSQLCDHALAGQFDEAAILDQKLQPLHTGLFIEPSPAATKWALSEMGMIEVGLRLPIIPLGASSQPLIRQMLTDLELL